MVYGKRGLTEMVSLFEGSGDRERGRRDELLSAYVDGELSAEERNALEARLSQDSELRAELRAMHRTVSLMRELPEVEAPRNFILTESMTGRQAAEQRTRQPRRRAAWVAPLLTLATTVVSLLFVVVLVGDLLLPGTGGMMSAPAPLEEADEAPAVALEAAPTEELEMERSVAPSEPSPPPQPTAEVEEKDMMEEPQKALEEEEEEALSATEALRATQAPAGAGALPPPTAGEAVAEEEGALSEPTATPASTPEPDVLSVPTVAPAVTPAAVLTPTIPAEEPVISEDELGLLELTPGELEVTPEVSEDGAEMTEVREPRRVSLSAIEILLGLSSLMLIIVTVQVWRRR